MMGGQRVPASRPRTPKKQTKSANVKPEVPHAYSTLNTAQPATRHNQSGGCGAGDSTGCSSRHCSSSSSSRCRCRRGWSGLGLRHVKLAHGARLVGRQPRCHALCQNKRNRHRHKGAKGQVRVNTGTGSQASFQGSQCHYYQQQHPALTETMADRGAAKLFTHLGGTCGGKPTPTEFLHPRTRTGTQDT